MQCHADSLMFAKMQFFHNIANILSEFLTNFQTDKPVMPFLSDLLKRFLRTFMKSFILAEVIKATATYGFDRNIRLLVSSVNWQQPLRLFFLHKVYQLQKNHIFDKVA